MKKLVPAIVGLVLALGLTVLTAVPVLGAAKALRDVTMGSQTGSLTYGSAGSATYAVTIGTTGSGSISAHLAVTTTLPSGVTAAFSPNPWTGARAP